MNPSSLSPMTYLTQKAEKEKYQKFVKFSLQEDYFMMCIKKCIKNFDNNLSGPEKVCLAKCVDRSYDYFVMEERSLNPFVERKESKFVYNMAKMFDQR